MSKDQSSSCELQLILCGARDGQDVCLREPFHVSQANGDFDAAPMLNEIVLAWMQGESVPGNTRPVGSDGATE